MRVSRSSCSGSILAADGREVAGDPSSYCDHLQSSSERTSASGGVAEQTLSAATAAFDPELSPDRKNERASSGSFSTKPAGPSCLLMSASPRKRRSVALRRDDAKGHKPTYAVQQIAAYSITSSAVASSAGGTSRSSVLATLRLITNSYLLGACTGSSLGFALRMRSTYSAARLKTSIVFGP
jgi:hypothetical protein